MSHISKAQGVLCSLQLSFVVTCTISLFNSTSPHCFFLIAIFIGFSETQYSVQEDVGVFHPGPVTILKENFVTSEQLLSVSVTFVTQTATSGATIIIYMWPIHGIINFLCVNILVIKALLKVSQG